MPEDLVTLATLMKNQSLFSPIVFVVNNDASFRLALSGLLCSIGLRVAAYGSAQDFMQRQRPDVPSCLILEVRLPGINGLDFQGQLAKASDQIPIIFITAHGDVAMSVRAMKAGAIDFLTKPFRDQDVLDSIHIALERDRDRIDRDARTAGLRDRLDSLTSREREIVSMVVSGMPNKLIAAQIGISENTVKVHRSR
jgi:RNA polymerase sigma factor (sigma-70 family)